MLKLAIEEKIKMAINRMFRFKLAIEEQYNCFVWKWIKLYDLVGNWGPQDDKILFH